MSRRTMLRVAGGWGLAAWLGFDLELHAASLSKEPALAPRSTRRGILRLRLKAPRLDEMQVFYGEVLGFQVRRGPGRLQVEAGGTELVFEAAAEGEEPIYHLAWAISENKLALAKTWLAARTPLLVHPDGRDEFLFRAVERSAIYFADPAGNVLELIARHRLQDSREGPFTLSDILYVNHAGLVVDDMDRAIRELGQGLGLRPLGQPTPTFTRLGDEHRHLVLVPRERLWLPEFKVPAAVFPTEIAMHGGERHRYEHPRLPYRLIIDS